jgi:hypothetical protein
MESQTPLTPPPPQAMTGAVPPRITIRRPRHLVEDTLVQATFAMILST